LQRKKREATTAGKPLRRGARARKIIVRPPPPFCPMPEPPALISPDLEVDYRRGTPTALADVFEAAVVVLAASVRRCPGPVRGRGRTCRCHGTTRRQAVPATSWPRAAAEAGGGSDGAHRQGPPRVWKIMLSATSESP
jgi:hypothetical protein